MAGWVGRGHDRGVKTFNRKPDGVRWVRCALVCAGACVLVAGGCASRNGGADGLAAWRLGEAEGPARARGASAGGSWGLVFNSPTVNRAHAGTDAREFAEYSRNDAALGYRDQGPVMASSEWPERERASLAYPRRVYLDPRADQLLFFEHESRYRGSYRYAPVAPGDGLWGFWR